MSRVSTLGQTFVEYMIAFNTVLLNNTQFESRINIAADSK